MLTKHEIHTDNLFKLVFGGRFGGTLGAPTFPNSVRPGPLAPPGVRDDRRGPRKAKGDAPHPGGRRAEPRLAVRILGGRCSVLP